MSVFLQRLESAALPRGHEPRFLISNELEQLELKLEKIIGIQKSAGKVRKGILKTKMYFCPYGQVRLVSFLI